MVRIVVKRGEFQRFDDLYKVFVPNGAADVVWDRRLRERRKGKASSDVQERRKAERRSPHPVSWTGLGFLVCDRKDRTA
jgi:hypothetical protein